MKKFIVVLCVFSILFLFSCAATDTSSSDTTTSDTTSAPEPENTVTVEEVNSLIDNIDMGLLRFGLTYKTRIAQKAYEKLSDSNKKLISDYEKLEQAIAMADFADPIYEKERQIENNIENLVTKALKAVLKNPSSLQLHECGHPLIYYNIETGDPIMLSVDIDYSAQNGFGGYNRENKEHYYRITKNDHGDFELQAIGEYTYRSIFLDESTTLGAIGVFLNKFPLE